MFQGPGRIAPNDDASTPRAKPAEMRREVGLLSATLSGTGVIVGAGVYALIGEGAGLAGNAVWISFILAAVVAGLTAISYARMVRRVPKDSPEFQYARLGLGFRAGFTAGWLMLWADIVATATVALAFGGYFASLFEIPVVPAALAVVLLLVVVATLGIRESLAVVALLTLAEVGGLVFVIALGMPELGSEPLFSTKDGLSGIWAATSLIFFAYIGFDELGNLAEEMRQPQRDLPRAIVLAMALSTLLYVLVAVSAVSLIGSEALAASDAPLADAVASAVGANGKTGLAFLALLATANTVLLLLVSGSRSLFGMANAGAMPRLFARLSTRKTPATALTVVGLLVGGFVLTGDIGLVARISTFATLVAFTLVNLSLFVTLTREAGWRVAITRPASLLQPLLGAGACAWLALDVGWTAGSAGVAMAFVGYAIGVFLSRQRVPA